MARSEIANPSAPASFAYAAPTLSTSVASSSAAAAAVASQHEVGVARPSIELSASPSSADAASRRARSPLSAHVGASPTTATRSMRSSNIERYVSFPIRSYRSQRSSGREDAAAHSSSKRADMFVAAGSVSW